MSVADSHLLCTDRCCFFNAFNGLAIQFTCVSSQTLLVGAYLSIGKTEYQDSVDLRIFIETNFRIGFCIKSLTILKDGIIGILLRFIPMRHGSKFKLLFAQIQLTFCEKSSHSCFQLHIFTHQRNNVGIFLQFFPTCLKLR